MALFDTTIGIGWNTSVKPDAGIRPLKMEDGSVITLQMYVGTVYDVQIECPFVTAAQLTTILAFYAANSQAFWTFQHPGDGFTYTLLFTNEPEVRRNQEVNPAQYTVTITAIGVRS